MNQDIIEHLQKRGVKVTIVEPVSGLAYYAQKGDNEGKRLVARLEKKLAKKGLI